jgi:TolB protein
MIKQKNFLTVIFILCLTGCNLPASGPTPDLFATLQASTPSGLITAQATQPIATLNLSFASATPEADSTPTSIPSPSASDNPTGRIVFTCQVFKDQGTEQICLMNADGSEYRRLTTENNTRHYYPSLSPNGKQVLYSAFVTQNNYDVFRLDLATNVVDQLTSLQGVDNAPEYSSDGNYITFMHNSVTKNTYEIFVMNNNGGDLGNIPQISGWDPTWSPDGNLILFASDKSGTVQLYTVKTDGSRLRKITNLPAIRGRSDWSPDGQYIVTYSGESWKRELFIMNADGSGVRQLAPGGGNSQGPSFSPDGRWVVFTAYFDHPNDDNGCEIYIIRVDGTGLRRLTNNDYCDYQPRWGP